MSVIIRLQGLPWSASAMNIRHFFSGLSIPAGGVHIIGGDGGDAFIAFSSDDDARMAMKKNMCPLNGTPVQLFLSSKAEMQSVIDAARSGNSVAATTMGSGGPANTPEQRQQFSNMYGMDNQNNSNAGHQNSGFSTDIANQWQSFQMYGGRTDGQSIPHFSMQNQRPSSEDGFYTGIQNVGDQRNQFGVLQQPTKVTPESTAPFSDTKQLQQNILNSIGLGTLSQQPKTDNQCQMSDKHNLFAEPSATGNLSSSNANKQNDSAALIHNILNKGQNSFPELMAAGRGFSALPSRIGPGISSEKTAMDASKQHLSSDKFTGQFMDDSKSSPFMKAETKKEMSQWANSIQQETGLVNNQKAFEMDGKMDNTLMMSRDKFINSENRPFDQFPPRGPSAEKMNRSLGTGSEISSDLGVPGIARQEPPFSGRTGGRHPGEAEQGGRFSMERFPERISDRFNENVRPGPEDSMPSTRYPPDEESEPSMAEPRQGRFHQIRGRPDDRFNDERQFPAPPGDHRFPPDDRRMLNRGPGFPLEPFSEGDKKFPPRGFDNQFSAEDQRYGPDNRGFPPGLEGRKFPPDDGRFPPDKRMQHDTEGFLGRHPGDNPFAPDDARYREREEELRQRAMAFERGRRPDERYMYEGHRGDMEYEEQGEGRFIPPDHRLGPDRGFREGDEREFRGPFPLMGDRRDGPSRWDHFGGEGEGNFQRGGPRAPLLDNPEMLGSRRHDRPPHSMGSEEPMDMDQRAGRGMDEMKGPGFEERRLGFGGRGGPGFDGRPGPGFDGRPGPGFEGRFEGRLGPGFEGRPGPGFDGRPGPGFDGRPGPGFDGRPGFEGRGGPGFEGRPGFDGRPGFGNDGIKEGFRGAGMEGMRGRGLDGMRGRGGEGRGRGMEGRGAPGMEVPARPGMNDENRFEYGRPGPANMNDEEYGLGDHDSRFQGPVGRGGMFDRRGRGDLFIRGRSGPFGRGRGFDIDRRFDDGGPEGRFDSDARNIGRHDGPMRPGPDKAPEITLKPGSGKGLLGDAPSVDKEKDSKSSTDKKDSENTKRDDHRSRRSNDRDRERRSSDRRDRDRDRSRYRYERDRRRSRSRDRSSRDKDSRRSRDRSRDHGSPRRENRSRCVVLKNMPNTITYKDVRRFLHPLEIPYDGLKLINDESGQRTGEVFVQFRRTDDASRAVRRNGERLSGQQVSISSCTEADFSKAVDSFVGKKEATNNPADKSSTSATKEVDSDKIRYIVQLQNLPKMVTKQDIVQFFKGLTIENNGEACYIEFDSAGVATGKSFVEFKSDYDYKKALTQDGSLLGTSTVRVFPGKKEEADDLKNKQQEMFQRAAIHNLSGGKVTQSLMRQQAPNTRPGLTGPRAAVANQQTSQSNRPATPVSEGTPPQVADTVCVHIQGLPLLATTQDIREFFSDCQIAMRGINIAHDGKGKPLGEGFVEFKFKSDFEKGIKKDKTSFGRHIVAVKPIAKKDMIERLENARQRGLSPPKISNQPIEDQKKMQDQAVQQPAQTQLAPQKTVNAPQISGQPLNNSAVAPAGNKPVPQGVTVTPGGSKSIPPGVLNKNWFYVRCQNFPPDISIQEILNFFQGFSPIGDSIRLHYSNEGKPTGNAVVGFASADEAKKALHCLNTKPCRQNIVSLHPA